MCLQFAHFVSDKLKKEGRGEYEIRVEAYASLNGREPERLVDPNVNLAKESRSLSHWPWIRPMTHSLP